MIFTFGEIVGQFFRLTHPAVTNERRTEESIFPVWREAFYTDHFSQ
ncbi:hypothetical protein M067_1156 [Bacteroides fragilis str. J-143-4]|nr:hypothetical protein M067_1156 [Bacteroides fragilis str. J-143-4]